MTALEMTTTDLFAAAVEAVISGDLPRLQTLLEQNPALVTARSTAKHRATLLHYVAANGVENDKQQTPPNAVTVARLLLEAGAAVDALAETYGGGPNQTPLILLVTSVHPARAGLQSDLVEVLLDAGAAINGLTDDGRPLTSALATGFTPAAETLARRGARVDNLVQAAGLGQLERVKTFFDQDGQLKLAAAQAIDLTHRQINDPQAVLDWAFVFAAMHQRRGVADFLLQRGANIAAPGYQGFTALHYAAWHGHWPMIDLLLEKGAPLEAKQDYNGTVLDGTVWGAANAAIPGVDYLAVVERLLAAGANIAAVSPYPSGHAGVDAVLAQHGKRAA